LRLIDRRTMTEGDWLACDDPDVMLEFLRGKASDRKVRLFAVACCRRIWHLLIDERSKNAVLVVERDADQARPEEVAEAFHESQCAFRACEYTSDRHADAAWTACQLAEPSEDRLEKAARVALLAANAAGYPNDSSYSTDRDRIEVEYRHRCHLLRGIFGNPFRPASIDPAWLSPNIVALAQVIYDKRAFNRMPELADVLEAAGCHDADILGHCRQAGPHVRGCWVVDAVLGMS
jgi:hypothetical protein